MRIRKCINTMHFSYWSTAPGRRVDSIVEGSEKRMHFCTSTICPSGGCTSHVYDSNVLLRNSKGQLDYELSRWYFSITTYK